MIIFNEKEYIENILNTNVVPDDLSINKLIMYIAKYFYYDGITAKELKRIVFSTMDSFHLDTFRYRPFLYETYINNLTKNIVDIDQQTQPLREYNSIPLYRSEYEQILQCKTRRQQKLLATLIFLARYNYNSGYTTTSRSVISKLSNIKTSRKEFDLIAHSLKELDGSPFVGMNYNSNKACTWIVNLEQDRNSEVVYEFTEPANIGNQIIAFIHPEYITCEICGRLVKKHGFYDNRKKYCSRCAEEVNRKQTRERMRKKYNESKNALKTSGHKNSN